MADDHVEGHKSTRPSAMKRSELEVNQVISTFEHFLNPFQISAEQGQQLFCLSSGKPASAEVANDLLGVHTSRRARSQWVHPNPPLVSHGKIP